jgi:hypothetical protein
MFIQFSFNKVIDSGYIKDRGPTFIIMAKDV